MKVKTRFAPSPTGNLHIGSIRTALYSWLFAKRYNGKFVLRIEDTDLKRAQDSSIESIINGLKWLGINWDEGPYFQTKRLDRYKEMIDLLLNKKSAYKCFCSHQQLEAIRIKQINQGLQPRYPGTCRHIVGNNVLHSNYVIRFKNPSFGQVTFYDEIRGNIIFDNTQLDDLIIQRSNGMPTYNFCSVIDDLDMEITHIIRGEDHINNTPRQINIIQALGASIPIYAHLSMILDESGHKISKRNNALNIIEYYKNGFLPEALLNYIVRLGWSHGDQEIFSILEMKKLFNLASVSKSSSIISIKKLFWINKYYINHSPEKYISDLLRKYMIKKNININKGPDLEKLVKLLKSRYYTLKDIAESCRYFYEDFSSFHPLAADKYFTLKNYHILQKIHTKIKNISSWNYDSLSESIQNLSLEQSFKIQDINMILRVCVTGNMHSPSIISVLELIGQKKTISRIKKAIIYIKNLYSLK